MPSDASLPIPTNARAMGGPPPAAAAFRELGQTVKKDHQAVGTDPSGERAIATKDTRMAMADPERASSGAQEASCCGVPVSKSRQTEHTSEGQSNNQFPKAHRVHVSRTEGKPVSKSTQTERMSAGRMTTATSAM